jgi:alpha/beta superfamily hydrolase
MTIEIRAGVELPARREDIELHTEDGLTLVGEIALPVDQDPVATLVCRKMAARLPALAQIAVLRFNFRGVTSPRGTSQGSFGDGVDERLDLAAAMAFVAERGLPRPWLVGWSFGTEVALKHGLPFPIEGVILLSPPLRRTTPDELAPWADRGVPVVALVPELDDFLKPDEARQKFAVLPAAEVVAVDDAKHLWVGETHTSRVLSEIVQRVNPAALPLPTTWNE